MVTVAPNYQGCSYLDNGTTSPLGRQIAPHEFIHTSLTSLHNQPDWSSCHHGHSEDGPISDGQTDLHRDHNLKLASEHEGNNSNDQHIPSNHSEIYHISDGKIHQSGAPVRSTDDDGRAIPSAPLESDPMYPAMSGLAAAYFAAGSVFPYSHPTPYSHPAFYGHPTPYILPAPYIHGAPYIHLSPYIQPALMGQTAPYIQSAVCNSPATSSPPAPSSPPGPSSLPAPSSPPNPLSSSDSARPASKVNESSTIAQIHNMNNNVRDHKINIVRDHVNNNVRDHVNNKVRDNVSSLTDQGDEVVEDAEEDEDCTDITFIDRQTGVKYSPNGTQIPAEPARKRDSVAQPKEPEIIHEVVQTNPTRKHNLNNQSQPRGQINPGSQSQPRAQINPVSQSQPHGQINPGNQSQPHGQINTGSQSQPRGQINPGSQLRPRGQFYNDIKSQPHGQNNLGSQSQPHGQINPGSQSQPRGQINPGSQSQIHGQFSPGRESQPLGHINPSSQLQPLGQLNYVSHSQPSGPLNSHSHSQSNEQLNYNSQPESFSQPSLYPQLQSNVNPNSTTLGQPNYTTLGQPNSIILPQTNSKHAASSNGNLYGQPSNEQINSGSQLEIYGSEVKATQSWPPGQYVINDVIVHQPSQIDQSAAPRVKNYIPLSIFVSLCCCLPLGILALIKAREANRLRDEGRYAEAVVKASSSLSANIFAIVFGLILIGCSVGLAFWRVTGNF